MAVEGFVESVDERAEGVVGFDDYSVDVGFADVDAAVGEFEWTIADADDGAFEAVELEGVGSGEGRDFATEASVATDDDLVGATREVTGWMLNGVGYFLMGDVKTAIDTELGEMLALEIELHKLLELITIGD